MSTSQHPVAPNRLRIAGITAQALAAAAALVALVLAAPAFLGGSVVLPLVIGGWCLAGPFLFAAATRGRRTDLELLLVFALVGPGPVLLIAGGYGIARLLNLI